MTNRIVRHRGMGLLVAIVLGISLILAVASLSGVIKQTKLSGKIITVKGFAEKPIVSDLGVWRGQLTARSPELAQAYQKIEADRKRVVQYLQDQGIKPETVQTEPITVNVMYRQTDRGFQTSEVQNYELFQTLSLESSDVQLLKRVSQDIMLLLSEGVEFRSFEPEFYYSKLNDLKIEMLGEAARDAHQRAEKIAQEGGGKLTGLYSSQQGVFQITSKYSSEISAEGVFNRTSIEKNIRAIVTASFGLE